jgi:hypothetical protein
MIIETDTRDKIRYGHIDDVVGGENALVLDFPFAGGVLPDYELLHEGACTIWEMSGL